MARIFRKHYHVHIGLRGCYMPDDSSVYRTLREAKGDASERARRARDEGETVKGSARSWYYRVGAYNSIQIATCDMNECLEGSE